jgi:putative transposase
MTKNTKSKRSLQIQKNIVQSLKNLQLSCDEGFSFEEFNLAIIESMMLLDREHHLEELRTQGKHDKSNGSYSRRFRSLSRNALSINIPRTRTSEFKPLLIEILKYNKGCIDELALTLYSKGLTTRDISDIFKTFFSEEISFSQVSKLADQFNELRQIWQNAPLQNKYKVLFCDVIFIKVKRGNSYSNEGVHIIYGVREDNKRELVELSINPIESSTSWGGCFSSIKNRGVKEVDLIIADGLPYLENEVHKFFPGSQFQKCVVHKMRNVLNKVRPSDKAAVATDLKLVFDNFDSSATAENANIKLESFLQKWRKTYPYLANSFAESTTDYYFTYINFPCEVRRMIYTTNQIESLNKKLRKATKNKQSFENPERLLDFLFVIIKDFEEDSWMKYPVSAFSIWLY